MHDFSIVQFSLKTLDINYLNILYLRNKTYKSNLYYDKKNHKFLERMVYFETPKAQTSGKRTST